MSARFADGPAIARARRAANRPIIRDRRAGPGDPQAGDQQFQNDFWQFSLALYGQPGVARECLELQDKFGLNINLLLFCAWLGRRGVALGRDDLEGASRLIASWHDHVVHPLRRRAPADEIASGRRLGAEGGGPAYRDRSRAGRAGDAVRLRATYYVPIRERCR